MKSLLPGLSVCALLFACSYNSAPLQATDVVVTAPRPGMQMSAGYFTLTNSATQPINITHVTSPQFEAVEKHESVIEDGMARMYPLGDLMVPAGSSIVFEPGGKHLMLMRPIGEFDLVTLQFHADKAVLLTVSVALTN